MSNPLIWASNGGYPKVPTTTKEEDLRKAMERWIEKTNRAAPASNAPPATSPSVYQSSDKPLADKVNDSAKQAIGGLIGSWVGGKLGEGSGHCVCSLGARRFFKTYEECVESHKYAGSSVGSIVGATVVSEVLK